MSTKTTLRVVQEVEVETDRIVEYIFANLGDGDVVEIVDDDGPVLLADDPLRMHGRELESRVDAILDGDLPRDCFRHGENGRGNATHVVEIDGEKRPVCTDLANEYRRRGYDVEPIVRAAIEP